MVVSVRFAGENEIELTTGTVFVSVMDTVAVLESAVPSLTL